MRIVIDPGHSGACEPGACAAGVTEADVVLAIAEQLSHLLLAAGHSILMTRSGDCPLTGLKWRAQLANCWNASLFISIHANSFADPGAHGSEVYYFPGSGRGLTLARLIQAQLVRRLHTADRGSKQAMFTVLNTGAISCCAGATSLCSVLLYTPSFQSSSFSSFMKALTRGRIVPK